LKKDTGFTYKRLCRVLLNRISRKEIHYYFAEDFDSVCCKMTCLNFLPHGYVGEVVHHNSFDPESYYAGWKINRTLNLYGIPSIERIEKEQSRICTRWQAQKKAAPPMREQQQPQKKIIQLSL